MSIREKLLLPFAAVLVCLLLLGAATLLPPDLKPSARVLALACAGAAAASWLIGLAVAEAVVRPIRSAAESLTSALTNGQRSAIDGVERNDELGDMLTAVSNLRDEMEKDTALLREREDELQLQNRRFETALSNMSHGLAMFDGNRRLIVSNARYAEIYKLPPKLVRPGTPQPDILAYRVAAGTFAVGDAAKEIQARVDTASNGETRESVIELSDGRILATTHRPMPDGGWVSTHQDITERRRAEAQVEFMARHDALTNLPNRVQFSERMQNELARIARHGGTFALLCFDLDHFKAVNDTLGHPAGDMLLKMVSERVLACVRDTDMVARFGGDEFAVLQIALNRPDEATLLAARIVEAVSKPFDIEGQQVNVGASIGIAAAPDNGSTAEELLKKADLALYRAKAEGRGTYRFFEPAMDAAAQERRALELDLRNAIARSEFTLEYHALVGLDRDLVSGFEALLRWLHPTRGVVLPSEFFRVAEEIGLIVPIGNWVLQQACADAAAWPDHMKVAVDVWPAQFRSGTLVDQVLQALASSGLTPSRLELEITESVLLQDNAATLGILHQLRELGVRISMDDFGTGFSSLSYLRSFPFDKVKIDRSFVRALSEDGDSVAVLQAVRGLGNSLSVATTADGVESREQLEKLRAEGCTEVQGYYFGPPRCASDIPSFLSELKGTRAAA